MANLERQKYTVLTSDSLLKTENTRTHFCFCYLLVLKAQLLFVCTRQIFWSAEYRQKLT